MKRSPIHQRGGPGLDLADAILGTYVEWFYRFDAKMVLIKIGTPAGPVVAEMEFETAWTMALDIISTVSAPDPQAAWLKLHPGAIKVDWTKEQKP